MLDDILGIIFKAAYWLLVPVALLRLYMQWRRIPFRNPLGAFVCAITDWLVLPLRRVLKGALGGALGFDWPSLAAAMIFEWGLAALFDVVSARFALFNSSAALTTWIIAGGFGLLTTALNMMIFITIVAAVLSWMRADNPLGDVLDALAAPWLQPIRRRLPMVGGFDLSPLVLIVLLQIALVILARAQTLVLMALR